MTERLDRRALWAGAGWWLAFCVLAVCVRGVRWEETFERAQILLGRIPYPEGHPLFRYAHNAFTVQYYLSAALLWASRSPAFVCGFRDVLTLSATVIPVYVLTAVLSRRAVFGHVASTFALCGVLVAFGAYYPMFVWPDRFTSGHIGMGVMVLAVALLAGGCGRSACFLSGLAICIHVGQSPIVLALAAAYVFGRWRTGRNDEARACLVWGCAGLGISAAVWALIRLNAVPVPAGGAFFSAEDAATLWRQYVFGEDIHRSFARFAPVSHSVIVLAGMILTGACVWWSKRRREGEAGQGIAWPTVYAILVAAACVVVAVVDACLGDRTPFSLVVWMPYRLPNHVAVLLLSVALSVVAGYARDERGTAAFRWLLAAVLLALLARPFLMGLCREGWFSRYLSAPEGVLFLLVGAAWGSLVLESVGRRAGVLIMMVPAWLLLAAYHQFGAACLLGGAAVTCALLWSLKGGNAWKCLVPGDRGLVALCVLVLAVALWDQWLQREHLDVTPFQREAASRLRAEGRETAMVVTPHWWIGFQETTGHPVLYTYETPQLMTYMPDLAPGIIKIRRDIYDIRLGEPWDYELGAWLTRSRATWQSLAREYGFGYVVSPARVPLDLPLVFEMDGMALYRAD